jgi:hypothetical protein
MLQWTPRVRMLLLVLALVAVALVLGWADIELFLEW